MQQKLVICLMGATATGKSDLALELARRYPCQIVSVDSALIYRDMNIGTAKPETSTLNEIPHALIDILDPSETYSAGQFCRDALNEINKSHRAQKIPLLVGGTMLYFKSLQSGLVQIPTFKEQERSALRERLKTQSLPDLHAELDLIDPQLASRIHPNDAQRIHRALEVFYLTGERLSDWQTHSQPSLSGYTFLNLGLIVGDRTQHSTRIANRFATMLDNGFLTEVAGLFHRGDLHADLPATRSVGYRQAWGYFNGEVNYASMVSAALAATRQLAKHQMTWLKSWPDVSLYEIENAAYQNEIFCQVEQTINQSHSLDL